MRKNYIIAGIGITLGLLFLFLQAYDLPAVLFVHGTYGGIGTPILVQLVNSAIYFVLAIVVMISIGFFKNMKDPVIGKYGVLFLLFLIISAIAEFIGHFKMVDGALTLDYGYHPTPQVFLFDAVLDRFLKNASSVLSLTLVLKSVAIINIPKKKYIIPALGAILYAIIGLIPHIGLYASQLILYIIEGFSIGILTGYLVEEENVITTPALFYGCVGITALPSYFAINSAMQPITIYTLIISYSILAVILILVIILKKEVEEPIVTVDRLNQEYREQIMKELMGLDEFKDLKDKTEEEKEEN